MVMEVHPPHEPIESVREFMVHILAITVGLLIAVGIEGLVEWQHHRHLVHEAEASLHGEIKNNADSLQGTLDKLKKEEAVLKHDSDVLDKIITTGKVPKNEHLDFSLNIQSFDNVAWKTAQATGASSYMSYAQAQKYADIYTAQDWLTEAEHQAARDSIMSLAPFVNWRDNDPDPTPAEAKALNEKVGVLRGQLLLVDSLMQALDQEYKKFLAANPEK